MRAAVPRSGEGRRYHPSRHVAIPQCAHLGDERAAPVVRALRRVAAVPAEEDERGAVGELHRAGRAVGPRARRAREVVVVERRAWASRETTQVVLSQKERFSEPLQRNLSCGHRVGARRDARSATGGASGANGYASLSSSARAGLVAPPSSSLYLSDETRLLVFFSYSYWQPGLWRRAYTGHAGETARGV